mmetsp:Transcript_12566/g.34857  ORF Transcript_12566/g.34857 Transcript_12566/m.34857 type:complete len:205 (+) Transcript_12566:38-652(+)
MVVCFVDLLLRLDDGSHTRRRRRQFHKVGRRCRTWILSNVQQATIPRAQCSFAPPPHGPSQGGQDDQTGRRRGTLIVRSGILDLDRARGTIVQCLEGQFPTVQDAQFRNAIQHLLFQLRRYVVGIRSGRRTLLTVVVARQGQILHVVAQAHVRFLMHGEAQRAAHDANLEGQIARVGQIVRYRGGARYAQSVAALTNAIVVPAR